MKRSLCESKKLVLEDQRASQPLDLEKGSESDKRRVRLVSLPNQPDFDQLLHFDVKGSSVFFSIE